MKYCVICGSQLGPRRKGLKPVKTCGHPDCLLELRKRNGREQATIRAKKFKQVECLMCGCTFKTRTDSMGIPIYRRCYECRYNLEVNPLGADWWGALPI